MGRSFTPFRSGILTAAIDLDTAALKVACVAGYTFNPAHSTLADLVGAGAVVNGVSAALTGVTVVDGVFNADPAAVTVAQSAVDHVLVLFQASAVTGGADIATSSQRLIAYLDTGDGLPIQPVGPGTVTVTWGPGVDLLRVDQATTS